MASLFESEKSAEVRLEKERRETELDTLERRSNIGWRDRLFAGPQERYGIAKRGIDKAFGKVSPEMEEVKKQQEAMKEAARSGGKPGSVEYYEAAQKYLYDNGMPKQAAEVQKYIDAAQARDDKAAKEEREVTEETRKQQEHERKMGPKAATKEELEAGKNYYESIATSGTQPGHYLDDVSKESKNAIIQDAVRRASGKNISVSQAMNEIAGEQLKKHKLEGTTWWNDAVTSPYISDEPATYKTDVTGTFPPATRENIANAEVGSFVIDDEGNRRTVTQEAKDAVIAELNATPETQAETTPDAVPLPATEETAEDTTATTLPVTETFDEKDALQELAGIKGKSYRSGIERQNANKKVEDIKKTIPEFKQLENLEKRIEKEALGEDKYHGAARLQLKRKKLREYKNRPEVKKRITEAKKRLQEKIQFRLYLKKLNKTPEQLTDKELPTLKAYGS
jgi:hypothetical protein